MSDVDVHDPASSPGSTGPPPGLRHRNLVLTAALLTTVSLCVVAAYGAAQELFMLQALAWDMVLAALTAWICLHADSLRRRYAAACKTAEEGADDQRAADRYLSWDAERRAIEEPDEARGLWDLDHARKLHYLFLALIPTAAIVALAGRALWLSRGETVGTLPATSAATALALVCLAGSCVWLMLARSFAAVAAEELPERAALTLLFRELQWACVLTAAVLLLSWVWPVVTAWAGRLLLGWVIVVGIEQLARLLRAWLAQPEDGAWVMEPLRLAVREAVFVHGNPVRSFFDALEARWGVSFRSSWALRFVRRSVVPTLLLVGLLLWGLSSLAIVQIDELGVRESLGRIQAAPLPPGLHAKLPWPFGRVVRYPVKRVVVRPIGFVSNPGRQSNFLWSQKHAQEEFALVLGNGSELVAIDCAVYYKIHEDRSRFLDYVYQCQNPDDALEAYAYRTLTESTRSTTLREVLTANRAQFADHLERTLRGYVESNHLGIEVVDVALMGLHPPVEAAADYLDVISARIDAERVHIEALGDAAVRVANVQQESASAIASAKVEAARRTGEALGESSQFLAIGEAYAVAPEPFQLRLWFEALEEILEQKRFVLVDQAVAEGSGGILLDHRGRAAVGEDPVPLTRDAGFTNPDFLPQKGAVK